MQPNARPTLARRLSRSGITLGLIGVLLLLVAMPSLAAQVTELAYTGCGGVDAPLIDDAYEARVVELVNQQRAANGNLPPLKRVAALGKSARYHATDLGTDNYFNHDTYDRQGGSLRRVCGAFDRMRVWYNWSNAGENVAAGYGTPEEVMAGWMRSEGHRDNLLDPDFREIGVGYFRGAGDYGVYWVQNFGARAGEYPVLINNDAMTTADRNVNVFVHGSWSEMRLRNDSGAWGNWQPFSSSFNWSLNSDPGERIISVELRSGARTHSTCDKINLVAAAGAEAAAPAASHMLYLPSVTAAQAPPQPAVTCN